jgi:O-acetyl-ADP-ribose deacetylase (regulator of RNase III)
MTLNTPGGAPASTRISASFKALSGVSSDGLKTIALPQASAGAAFQQAIWIG